MELKRCKYRQADFVAPELESTIVELKRGQLYPGAPGLHGLNRTIVELKHRFMPAVSGGVNRLNRTIVELKPSPQQVVLDALLQA